MPPIVAEMYAQGRIARLQRTLRSFSTLAGLPSLLVLVGFMLLGKPKLGSVYNQDIYDSNTAWLVLLILSAAKLVAVWSGSCGLVLQFTGHQASMLRVSLLTSPLFFVLAIPAAMRYRSGCRSSPDYEPTERDNGAPCQEGDRDVDPRELLPLPVSEGPAEERPTPSPVVCPAGFRNRILMNCK